MRKVNGEKLDPGIRPEASAPELLSPSEAAEFLLMPLRQLESWRYQRVGPKFIRLNHATIRYRRSDLIAFLNARTIDPAAKDRASA